jgi:hypothetical protein
MKISKKASANPANVNESVSAGMSAENICNHQSRKYSMKYPAESYLTICGSRPSATGPAGYMTLWLKYRSRS